MIFPKILPL